MKWSSFLIILHGCSLQPTAGQKTSTVDTFMEVLTQKRMFENSLFTRVTGLHLLTKDVLKVSENFRKELCNRDFF